MLPKPERRTRKARRPIRRRVSIAAKRAERKAAGYVDPDSWEAVIHFYGGRCAMECGRPWRERGHVVALARGGRHEIGNVMPLCGPDNAAQGTRTVWPPRRHPWMEAR